VKEETIAALAGTVIGAVIAGVITWLCTRSTNKMQERIAVENARLQQRAFIDSMVLKMLDILIEHPHLEKDSFCQSYPNLPTPNADAKERYESFCCFVFNLLMMAFNHFNKDPKKLGDYIGMEEILRKHHAWWIHDRDNLGYDEPFRQCIQSVIDKLRKDGVIK